MPKVNLSELLKLLPYFYSNRIPLYLWGKPSSGKTSILRQFAQEEAKRRGLRYSEDEYAEDVFTFKVIPLSQFDASDLRGMPRIKNIEINSKTYSVTEFIPGYELPRTGQGIIFFDEFNLADNVTRAGAYQYVLEGRYSNLPPVLDKDGNQAFWRVAASNTEQDYSNVFSTGLALLRRFMHLEVIPEASEVINYLLEHNGAPEVIAYLQNYPDDLFPLKWDETLLEKKANPFPYTWEMVSKLLKSKPDPKIRKNLVAACVGTEVAIKFEAFLKLFNIVSVEEVIKNPKLAFEKINSLGNEKVSVIYSLISSLAAKWYESRTSLKPETINEIMKYLDTEFQVRFFKMINKKNVDKLLNLPEINKVFEKVAEIYED